MYHTVWDPVEPAGPNKLDSEPSFNSKRFVNPTFNSTRLQKQSSVKWRAHTHTDDWGCTTELQWKTMILTIDTLQPHRLEVKIKQIPVEKKQHMLVRYVLQHDCWFKLVLSNQLLLRTSLGPAHDQLRTILNQIKPAQSSSHATKHT